MINNVKRHMTRAVTQDCLCQSAVTADPGSADRVNIQHRPAGLSVRTGSARSPPLRSAGEPPPRPSLPSLRRRTGGPGGTWSPGPAAGCFNNPLRADNKCKLNAAFLFLFSKELYLFMWSGDAAGCSSVPSRESVLDRLRALCLPGWLCLGLLL